jgi:hypothetical protein
MLAAEEGQLLLPAFRTHPKVMFRKSLKRGLLLFKLRSIILVAVAQDPAQLFEHRLVTNLHFSGQRIIRCVKQSFDFGTITFDSPSR